MIFTINGEKPAVKRRLTDEEYRFVFERVPRLCFDLVAVASDSARILLVRREIDPFMGCWSLPGGMVRYRESIQEAALRIISSELGLQIGDVRISIEKMKLVGHIEFPLDGPWLHSVSLAFSTILPVRDFRGSEQGHESQFFSSLPEKVHPYHGIFLREHWDALTKQNAH